MFSTKDVPPQQQITSPRGHVLNYIKIEFLFFFFMRKHTQFSVHSKNFENLPSGISMLIYSISLLRALLLRETLLSGLKNLQL